MTQNQNADLIITMSGVMVRGMDERKLLTQSTRQIVSIFLLSALSYMLGVAWYEAARATMDDIAREYPHFSRLHLTYIYTLVVTVTVLLLATMIHFMTRLHVKMTEEQ